MKEALPKTRMCDLYITKLDNVQLVCYKACFENTHVLSASPVPETAPSARSGHHAQGPWNPGHGRSLWVTAHAGGDQPTRVPAAGWRTQWQTWRPGRGGLVPCLCPDWRGQQSLQLSSAHCPRRTLPAGS